MTGEVWSREIRVVQRVALPPGYDRIRLLGQALSISRSAGPDALEDVIFQDLTCDRVDLVGTVNGKQVVDLVFTRKE